MSQVLESSRYVRELTSCSGGRRLVWFGCRGSRCPFMLVVGDFLNVVS